MPGLPVIVYPTPVQGEGAARSIAAAVRTASARAECDVLIVCRGGGSIEDLWAYNDEALARAIAACADPGRVRASATKPTSRSPISSPTCARRRRPRPRELASPDRGRPVATAAQAASTAAARRACARLEDRMQRLDYLSRRLTHPGERIRMQLAELGHLAQRFVSGMRHELDNDAWRTRDLGQRLVAAAPDLAGTSPPPTPTWRGACGMPATPPRDRDSCPGGSGRPPQAPEPAARARPRLQHYRNRRRSDRARRLQTRSRRRGAVNLREGLGRRGGQTSGKSRGLTRASSIQ